MLALATQAPVAPAGLCVADCCRLDHRSYGSQRPFDNQSNPRRESARLYTLYDIVCDAHVH